MGDPGQTPVLVAVCWGDMSEFAPTFQLFLSVCELYFCVNYNGLGFSESHCENLVLWPLSVVIDFNSLSRIARKSPVCRNLTCACLHKLFPGRSRPGKSSSSVTAFAQMCHSLPTLRKNFPGGFCDGCCSAHFLLEIMFLFLTRPGTSVCSLLPILPFQNLNV